MVGLRPVWGSDQWQRAIGMLMMRLHPPFRQDEDVIAMQYTSRNKTHFRRTTLECTHESQSKLCQVALTDDVGRLSGLRRCAGRAWLSIAWVCVLSCLGVCVCNVCVCVCVCVVCVPIPTPVPSASLPAVSSAPALLARKLNVGMAHFVVPSECVRSAERLVVGA